MKYYCKESGCNNKIHYNTFKYGQKRCRKCANKQHSKRMKDKNNPFYGKKHTIKTKKRISIVNNGKNNGNYIDGRCSKIYYCKEKNCNKEITIMSAIYGKGRCKSCAKKGKLNPIQSGKNNPNFGNGDKMKGKNNPMFGKIAHHSKKIKYKKILMRSSWEMAYAKYLDKLGIKWLYESKTFDLGDCTYTPDFYLPEQNKYIEIKGWWRNNDKRKFKLFIKKYPNKNIIVLMKFDLQAKEIL